MNRALNGIVLIMFAVLLMPAIPLHHSTVQKSSDYQISPSNCVTDVPKWLFNGSYASYTGQDNAKNYFSNYSITGVNLSAGTYFVNFHTNLGINITNKSHLNQPSIFSGANVSALSYFNSGKEPPWVNRSVFQTFTVNTGEIVSTKLGSYSADQVTYYAIENIRNYMVYQNVSFYPGTYSGVMLKENVSIHYGNTWNNYSVSLNSTNIPLGGQATNPVYGPYVYFIVGGIIAAAAVSAGLIYFKKVKQKPS